MCIRDRVYTYQKDMLDAEAFKEYANRLWKDSHSYSYSISDVYYLTLIHI